MVRTKSFHDFEKIYFARVESPQILQTRNFDLILIAVNDENVANKIKNSALSTSGETGKIFGRDRNI